MRKTDLTSFNTGGLHSQNKYGGVPQGIGPNGQINTIQEGETKYEDFVFSNDIKLNKSVIKEFNLPKYLEGKTAAQATKLIDNKFKDRNDKISLSTKTKMLDAVSNAQESIKAKRENLSKAFEANSTEVPDMMNGQIPEGFEQNQMFLGGELGNTLLQTGLQTGIGAASDAILPGSGMFTAPLAGVLSAGVGNMLNKGKMRKQAANEHINRSGMYQNDFALGGGLNDPINPNFRNNNILNMQSVLGVNQDGIFGPKSKAALTNWQKSKGITADGILGPQTYKAAGLTPNGSEFLHPSEEPNIEPRIANDPLYQARQDLMTTEDTLPTLDITSQSQPISNNAMFPKANLKPALNWLGNNYGDIMRYAPVATNLLQLNNLERPNKVTLNRLDNRYRPEYVDERSLQNIAGNELDNVSNSLTSATNGSQGTLRNSILAASLNRNKSLSDAYLNASDRNRQQNQLAQQFNASIDQVNLNQANQELDINDRNQAAYDTNKSRLISEIGNNIGEIGKEEVYKKIARNQFGYKWDGRYWIKPDGSTATDNEIKNEVANSTNQKKLGGILFKSKKY